MLWLNLETSILRLPEVTSASNAKLGVWLRVLLWAAETEQSGRVRNSKSWVDRQWQTACGVSRREVANCNPFLYWDGDDLVVWNYPLEKELEVAAKRRAGRDTAARRWAKADSSATMPRGSSADSSATSLPHAEEEKEKEKEVSVRKETKHTHSDCFSLAALAERFPHVDLKDELKKARQHCQRRNGRPDVDLKWFGEEWLPRCGPRLGEPTSAAPQAIAVEPEGWRDWIDQHAPDIVYASAGAKGAVTWAEVDPAYRIHLLREMGKLSSFRRADAA